MRQVTDINGLAVDFDAVVMLMDDEICEQLHAELAPCTEQEFFNVYAKVHKEKFGEEFAPYVGLAW